MRQAGVDRPDRVRDVPDPEVAIRLTCVPRSADRDPVAVLRLECAAHRHDGDPGRRVTVGCDPDTEVDVSFALRVEGLDGGVRVVWTADGVEGTGWRVLVIRTFDGSEPVDASRATTVGEGERGEALDPCRGLPAGTTTLRYRVVILDEGSGVVAGSAVHTFARPGS